MELEDKVVLITGGAHGIGRAMAERFQREGARGICVADKDLEGAERIAQAIGGLAMHCDVSFKKDIAAAIDKAESRLGPIDLFCSNAGVAFSDSPGWMATSQPDEKWELAWKVNVMAHVWAARIMVPRMIDRGGGYLLHTVSAAGLLSQIGDAVYSTTKHAAIGFAESVAINHGDQGIGISVLCPQAVATRMFNGEGFEAAANAASVDGVLTPAEVAATVVEGLVSEKFLILPHPRVGEYMGRKTADYDRWLGGMRRFRGRLFASNEER